MNPSYRLINQIKRNAGGKISRGGVERSLALIESDTPTGALMSTLATPRFKEVMLDVAQNRPRDEQLAWMTIAAAGESRVRYLVARRATRIVPPHELVEVVVGGGDLRAACEQRAELAPSEDEWGAWLLLASVGGRDLRRLVEAHGPLRRRYRAAKRKTPRPVNPQLAEQLQALGLV